MFSWKLFKDDMIRCRYLSGSTIIILVLGTILYLLSYESIGYHINYPPSRLARASIFWHFGTRFMSFWYPLGFFFIHWRKRGTIYVTIFVVGCVIGTFLAFACAILMDFYISNPNAVHEEYRNATKLYVEKTGDMPKWIEFDTENNCCTWPNGNIFKNSSILYKGNFSMKDTFMNKLLDCTGVQAANSSKNTMNFNEFLIEHKKQQGKIKKDCDSHRVKWMKYQHKKIFVSAVFISFFGVASFVLYIHYYMQFVRKPLVWSLFKKEPKPEVRNIPKTLYEMYKDSFEQVVK